MKLPTALRARTLEGGRIINVNGTLSPYYYTTDHLGSVRVITDASGNVTERNDYYAFGKRMTTGNTYPTTSLNRWKYNGKEVQTTGNVNWLDYGAREYDEVTGRWTRPDPMSEKYYYVTAYCYALNNSVNNIDRQGDTVVLYATRLPSDKDIPFATHTFISVKNINGDIQNFAYGSDISGIEGAFGGKLGRQFYDQDKQVSEGKNKKAIKNKFTIEPTSGMTSEEFDKKVIDVANSFGNNQDITYFLCPTDKTQGNCNTSTTTILHNAGVSDAKIKEYKSEIKGVAWGFGNVKPWTASEQQQAVEKQKKDLEQSIQNMLQVLQHY
ncbi:MAG TPA: RHS repeat-associated core domain-containing protein [Candidatus Egerieousia sp.]|nr:RHS repeat-associated core domain-containing protein [Candidatus Egerieousia sp.]HPT06246.1 RHS repeat-associated core domain-containing protein [Candidatus Egerieousia sp.]